MAVEDELKEIEKNEEEQSRLLREQRNTSAAEHREEIGDEDINRKGVAESAIDKVVGID